MLSIGLMTGTSMDGIDAALLETDGISQIGELGNVFQAYPPEMKILLKIAEFAVKRAQGDLTLAAKDYLKSQADFLQLYLGLPETALDETIANLAFYFHQDAAQPITLPEVIQHSTELHAQCVSKLLAQTGYKPKQIDVIGYHGQTLYHAPKQKISLQIGDGKLLAEFTGITTVNDFRSRDIAMGGQGAPFAPLYHQALAARDQRDHIAVINCGGIANISVITGFGQDEVFGFDTGPGNGLIDRCVRQFTHGKEFMDENGKYGKTGKVDNALLALLYQDAITVENYFSKPPPKSLDSNDLQLIPEIKSLTLADACRTLEAFTADTIVKSIDFFSEHIPTQWIVAGGGWNNPVIHHELINRLKLKTTTNIQVVMADDVGWNNQALEAQLCAYLAVRSLQQLPISMPTITQVPAPLTGGVTHTPSKGVTPAVAKLLFPS